MESTASASPEQRQVAFVRYVLPEVDVLLRVAMSLTRRPADAEDLVQDTLTRAFQGIGNFDGAYPRAWLLTIMRNTHINRNRRRRPELLDDPAATFERLAATEGVGAQTPEALVVGETFEAVVVDALDALPTRFRRVVDLVDIEGLSYAETAEALGIPVGTVMSRLHRARNRMRRRLVAAGLAPRRRP
ncbi:MAG: RNA polymerase sigma factor [Acidimicrobiales bacterium]